MSDEIEDVRILCKQLIIIALYLRNPKSKIQN